MHLIDLGTTDYISAYILQKEILEKIRQGNYKDTIIFCEHPHTITLGRNAELENILIEDLRLEERGIKLYSVDRGGDVTYHGPGQLLIYLILDLSFWGKDLRKFLRKLEILGLLTLKDFGIECEIREGLRGVWVKDRKIVSVGIGVKDWITYHGLSLNVNTDLSYFDLIRPCGLDTKMTSMEETLKERQNVDKVKERIFKNLESLFSKGLVSSYSGI